MVTSVFQNSCEKFCVDLPALSHTHSLSLLGRSSINWPLLCSNNIAKRFVWIFQPIPLLSLSLSLFLSLSLCISLSLSLSLYLKDHRFIDHFFIPKLLSRDLCGFARCLFSFCLSVCLSLSLSLSLFLNLALSPSLSFIGVSSNLSFSLSI